MFIVRRSNGTVNNHALAKGEGKQPYTMGGTNG